MRQDLSIVVNKTGNTYVVALEGQLDTYTAPQVEAAIGKIIAEGAMMIVLDCQKLSYISSAGLSTLVEAQGQLSAKDGKLVAAAMPPAIRNVFDILGFSQIIQVYDSVKDALAAK